MEELQGRLKDKDITWKIGASLGIGLTAYLLPQIILAVAIALLAYAQNKPLDEFIAEDNTYLNAAYAILVGLLSTGIVYLYLRKQKHVFRRLGFRKSNFDDIGLALPAYLVYFVLALIANIILAAAFPDVADQVQETGFGGATGLQLVLAFITLVIVAPLYEEILFRGFVFRGLAASTGFWPAALSSSALFGIAHGQLNVAIDTFLIGMVASWLVWKTGSLWPAILLHGIKNFVAYLFIFVFEVNI